VFDLVITGVADAGLCAARTQRIRHLGRHARDRRLKILIPCTAGPPQARRLTAR
jgi:hypothetical protein